MNRFKDYAGFTFWFVGLGYIVMWPLTMSDFGQAASGPTVCGQGAAHTDLLCDSAQPFMLPPGLHLIGLLAAVFVAARLLLMAIKFPLRKSRSVAGASAIGEVPRPGHPPPARELTKVKPRAHFGLRGPRP